MRRRRRQPTLASTTWAGSVLDACRRGSCRCARVEQRINGHVLLECVVNDDRRVTSCQVVEEEPSGIGFTRSALTLACRHSERRYGQPVDASIHIFSRADGTSRVRMPMRFNVEGAGTRN